MIATWWAGLSLAMKFLWGITLTATLIFIIQSILTFIGADASGDMDLDVPDGIDGVDGMDAVDGVGGGANLYTFRNFVNFFLGFGWSAILLEPKIKSTVLLIFVSVLVGILLVTLVMLLFRWLSSMQQSGNINVRTSAVGCTGKCYLAIPAAREGEGKVQISINNSVREYNAVTEGDAIPTGASIKVIDVVNNNTLLVEGSEPYAI